MSDGVEVSKFAGGIQNTGDLCQIDPPTSLSFPTGSHDPLCRLQSSGLGELLLSLLILMSCRVVSALLGVGFRLFFFTIGQTAAVFMQCVKKPVMTHFKEVAGSGSRGLIEELSRFIASVRPVESTVKDCLRPPTL